MFFGRGDFQRILSVLKRPAGSACGYKDIARKLALLKQGYLLPNGKQKGVNCETFDGILDQQKLEYLKGFGEDNIYKVYADKRRDYIKNAINYKWVF